MINAPYPIGVPVIRQDQFGASPRQEKRQVLTPLQPHFGSKPMPKFGWRQLLLLLTLGLGSLTACTQAQPPKPSACERVQINETWRDKGDWCMEGQGGFRGWDTELAGIHDNDRLTVDGTGAFRGWPTNVAVTPIQNGWRVEGVEGFRDWKANYDVTHEGNTWTIQGTGGFRDWPIDLKMEKTQDGWTVKGEGGFRGWDMDLRIVQEGENWRVTGTGGFRGWPVDLTFTRTDGGWAVTGNGGFRGWDVDAEIHGLPNLFSDETAGLDFAVLSPSLMPRYVDDDD